MIRVEPITLGWIEALAASDDTFAARFGLQVLQGWSGFPEAVPAALEYARSGAPPEWGFHLVIDDDGSVAGFAGWKGEPVDRVAELGYSVAPERQGRGIATVVVRELLSRGRAAGLGTALAHTLPERSASTVVLERCGFTHTADVADPDGDVDGVVWRWEYAFLDNKA